MACQKEAVLPPFPDCMLEGSGVVCARSEVGCRKIMGSDPREGVGSDAASAIRRFLPFWAREWRQHRSGGESRACLDVRQGHSPGW
jgi:hypothetical protein